MVETGAAECRSPQEALGDKLELFQQRLRVQGKDGFEEQPRRSFCSVGNGWEHEWKDDFDGDTLDSASWDVITSTGGTGHVATVGGLETTACRSAHCRKDNLRVTGGALRILTERNATTGKFSSGAITTKGRRAWGDQTPYRICIKAKLPGGGGGPSAQGIWPAHWMLPDNGISDRCLDEGEVDIMEMINGDGKSYSTYHWMASFPEKSCADYDTYHMSSHSAATPSDWGDSYHEYAVERSAGQLVFAVDGQEVLRVNRDQANLKALSHTRFFLILNTAVGGGWPGEPTEQTMSRTEHVIDYVHVVRRLEEEASLLELTSSAGEQQDAIGEAPPPISLTGAGGSGS